jgi:hypothetical protein
MKWFLPTTCALLLMSAASLSAQISLGPAACDSGQPGTPGPDAEIARWVNVQYTGPSVRKHCGQYYNVFVPKGPQPEGGWPVLVYVDISGFVRSSRREFIDPENSGDNRARLPLLALKNNQEKMAVVYASCTVARGGVTGNDVFDPTYDPWNTANPGYGADYDGNGLFIAPSLSPLNYSGLVPPYLDGNRPMGEKDAVMLVQHVKYHADAFPPGAAAPIQLNTSKMVVAGTSAGAVTLSWVALGPDRAAEAFPNPAPGSQEAINTRVPAAILDGGIVNFRRFKQDSEIEGFPLGLHLPALPNAPGPNFYDRPARRLGQVADIKFQDEASPLHYGWDGPTGKVQALNNQLKLYMAYRDPTLLPLPLCFDLDPVTGGPGACMFATDLETNIHPSWSGHVWKMIYPDTYLTTTIEAAYTYDGNQVLSIGDPNAVPDQVFPNSASVIDFAVHEMGWILDILQEPLGAWVNHGNSLDGTLPAPVLRGDGALLPGSPTQVFLKKGMPSAMTALVAGASRVDLPFLGGVMVPSMDVIVWGQTDSMGGAVLSTDWPELLPSGTQVFFQQWVLDVGAPFGASASNGLSAISP